jgi:hypothetical protein
VETSKPLQALLDVLGGYEGNSPSRLDATGWDAFVTEASRHGVAALTSLALARCQAVPANAMRSLEGHYLRNQLRNLRLFGHVASLLDRLGAEAIDVIVLKGAHLAQAVYADPAMRAMADADLLIRERDLERAAQTMRAMGWRQGTSERASKHQLPTFERQGVQVELHWTIEDDGSSFAIDVDGLWERAAPTRVGRAQALALSPADLLLHLCMHTAYDHGWKQFDGGLRQLTDIVAVLRHYGTTLDWHKVVACAEAWHAERCLSLCLATVRELLRVHVPQVVFDRLTMPGDRWQRVARELCLGNHYTDLVQRLPVFARLWIDKRWRGLSRLARWRECLLPARASLRHVYPTLEARALLLLAAHWRDLAGDALRIVFDSKGRALLSRERDRRALIAWLER